MKKKREKERCAFKISKKRKDIFRQQQKKQQLIHRSVLTKNRYFIMFIYTCVYFNYIFSNESNVIIVKREDPFMLYRLKNKFFL